MNDLEDEEMEDTFVIDRDLAEPESDGTFSGEVRLKQLPTDLEDQIMTLLRAVRKASPETIPDKRKRDEILSAVMGRLLAARLSEYSTDAQFDLGLLRQTELAGRQKMAVMVRHGEKTLLHEAINLVQTRSNGVNGSNEGIGHAAKRHKH